MHDKDGLISVVVPVYNAEKYLCKCLDSILGQTYTNLEVILVDDGSSDKSKIICDNYAKKDGRVYVIHKENQGVSAARNDGIRASKGEYIAFVDADDYILPEYFSYLHNLIKKYNADMSCCRSYKMWDTETMPAFNECDTERVFNAEEALQEFLYNKDITAHVYRKLCKRNVIGQLLFHPKVEYAEDSLFMFYLLQKCERVAYGSKILYIYVQNDNSSTHNYKYEKLLVSWKIISKELLEYAEKKKEIRLAVYFRLFVMAVMYCCAIKREESQLGLKKELLNAIKQYGRVCVKNKICKKTVWVMACISCISARLLVLLCKCNIFLRRKFRVSIRGSV